MGRELAAVFICECLYEWLVRETFKKAALHLGAKILFFPQSPKQIVYFLWTHDAFCKMSATSRQVALVNNDQFMCLHGGQLRSPN
jgi:hypothetical protein